MNGITTFYLLVLCLQLELKVVQPFQGCLLPYVPNGGFVQIPGNKRYGDNSTVQIGGRAQLRCDLGFNVVSGSTNSTCTPGRSWSPKFGRCSLRTDEITTPNLKIDRNSEIDNNCLGYSCKNGKCISFEQLCDQRNDCGDLRDERNCMSFWSPRCPGFTCGHQRLCLPNTWQCDGHNDCGDFSDEANCEITTTPRCNEGHFGCRNSMCIPNSWVCDGDNDCGDFMDEKFCFTGFTSSPNPTIPWQPPPLCPNGDVSCPTGRCIRRFWLCDGHDDCGDMWDENNCRNVTTVSPCSANDFQCPSRLCISQIWVCDGDNDCGDMADEQGCGTSTQRIGCPGFTCRNGKCTRADYVCDSDNDCGDMSDEENCIKTTPNPDICQGFFCANNGACIPNPYLCDGDNDCGNLDDETNCTVCQALAFKCRTLTKCIGHRFVCDGDQDCDDFSDEQNCNNYTTAVSTTLASHTCIGFSCHTDGCVPYDFQCDGLKHCQDGTDEMFCDACRELSFKCRTTRQCVSLTDVCDGSRDCTDGSDEENCVGITRTKPPCHEFTCDDGECIADSQRCNGRYDCFDNSDEVNCSFCNRGAFKCLTVPKCIPHMYICDFMDDCGDGTDERNCHLETTPALCSGFVCDNGRCITDEYVCDNDDDCLDNSDEQNCSKPLCYDQFTCGNGRCIPPSWVCDNDNDCGDDSDEINCPGARTSTETPCRGFVCRNGKCIINAFVCDGERDCYDGSDEVNCLPRPPSNITQNFFEKCGEIGRSAEIFGGGTAMIGQFPWMVKLFTKFPRDSGWYGCGSVILNEMWILTAAHCLVTEGVTAERVRILLGRNDLSSNTRQENGLMRWSDQLVIHRGFDHDLNNDFALIKMNARVVFQKNIRPICLPDLLCDFNSTYNSVEIDSCSHVEVAGWGRTEDERSPDVLRTARVSLKPRSRCNSYYGTRLSQAQFCLGTGDPTVCKGDSGGPAMCVQRNRYYTIGMVSWGDSCGSGNHPEVFARICAVLPWIRQTIQKN